MLIVDGNDERISGDGVVDDDTTLFLMEQSERNVLYDLYQ